MSCTPKCVKEDLWVRRILTIMFILIWLGIGCYVQDRKYNFQVRIQELEEENKFLYTTLNIRRSKTIPPILMVCHDGHNENM